MMRRAVLVIALALPSLAVADRRVFTSTYEYRTLPEGETELELWHTEWRDSWLDGVPQAMQHQLKIEHGLTEHWDAALSTVFAQVNAPDPMDEQPLVLETMKLESRYRFVDRGEWPVDVMAYTQAAKQFGASVYTVELRGVIARDFDKLTAAANVSGSLLFGGQVPEAELGIGWAAGASYELHPKLNVGAETFGSAVGDVLAAAAGPVIAVAPAPSFWVALTAGIGVTDDAPQFSARLLLGVEL